MILYTSLPGDIVMNEQNINRVRYIKSNNIICAVSKSTDGCNVERIVSTNLKDYLNKQIYPGTKIL